ncbi:hypothetical protein [Pseudomonas coronafaciens]|uniref:hypothetical protein n=1 Tax=Pseudomonas coronafaciens TaxID=53409 RepID=UPI00379A2A35
MNAVKNSLLSELSTMEDAINGVLPSGNVLSIVHGNWTFPGLSAGDFIAVIAELKNTINLEVSDDLGMHEANLSGFVPRLQFARAHTVTQLWGNSAQAAPAILFTLDALRRALLPVSGGSDLADIVKASRLASRQLNAIEIRVRELSSRSGNLDEIISRIESANETAHQLPEDLESLREGRLQLSQLMADAEKDRVHILAARDEAETAQADLAHAALDAADVVKKANQAYSTATSQGLAAAFAERSVSLGYSMAMWVAGLILALALGSYFGKGQLERLAELIKGPEVSGAAVALNLLLSVFTVGAPIWFAWLSTKQIGQRFRLSEDYAFKASVSKAYEGYRREANRVDPALEFQLLKSALTRLDEQPLRFVEPASYGSPWQELISSDLMKEAMNTVPNFSGQVTAFAGSLLARGKPRTENITVTSVPAAQPLSEESKV